MRVDDDIQFLWTGAVKSILPQISLVKVGGHFPGRNCTLVDLTSGSAIMHWDRSKDGLPSVILTADSIKPVPSGGISCMYSFPNLIGLSPDEMHRVWKAVKNLEFDEIYGGWYTDPVIRGGKAVILKSLQRITQIVLKGGSHPLLKETL
jgi:hypothetical protein